MAGVSSLDEQLIESMEPDGAPTDYDIQDMSAPDVTDASPRTAWRPRSSEDADWVARKARKAQAAIDGLVAQRDTLVAQADAWLDDARKDHDATVKWASEMLEVWLRREIQADDSKKPRKSRSLPAGVTVKLVAGRRRVMVDDAEAFVDWAEANDTDLLNVKVSADKTKLAKLSGDSQLVTADGEVVPGVSAEVGPDRVRVDLGGAV